MPLLPDLLTTVANTNFEAVADTVGLTGAVVLADAVSHQRTVNAIREGSLAVESQRLLEDAKHRLEAKATAAHARLAAISKLLG